MSVFLILNHGIFEFKAGLKLTKYTQVKKLATWDFTYSENSCWCRFFEILVQHFVVNFQFNFVVLFWLTKGVWLKSYLKNVRNINPSTSSGYLLYIQY